MKAFIVFEGEGGMYEGPFFHKSRAEWYVEALYEEWEHSDECALGLPRPRYRVGEAEFNDMLNHAYVDNDFNCPQVYMAPMPRGPIFLLIL